MVPVNTDIIFGAAGKEKISRNSSLYHEIIDGIKEYEPPLVVFMAHKSLLDDHSSGSILCIRHMLWHIKELIATSFRCCKQYMRLIK